MFEFKCNECNVTTKQKKKFKIIKYQSTTTVYQLFRGNIEPDTVVKAIKCPNCGKKNMVDWWYKGDRE